MTRPDQQALDPDRVLALTYVPTVVRPALTALWNLDARLGSVLRGGGDRMIAQIRLAWWRDALEALDAGPPPAEPVLTAVALHALPPGVGGADLAALEAGWSVLLEPELGPEQLGAYAEARGGGLFALSARLLSGSVPSHVAAAGEAWALTDLARHTRDPGEARAALSAARRRLAGAPPHWPRKLRPLGMLAMLAARDAAGKAERPEPYGSPARMLRMLRHRLTGR